MKEGPPKCIQVDHTHMHTNRKPPLLHLVYHLGSYADVHCRQTPSSIFQEGAKHHFAFVPSDCCHLQLIPLLPDTSHPSNTHFFFKESENLYSLKIKIYAQKCYKFKYFSWRLFLVLISLSSFYSFAFNSHFAYCVFALMHLVNVLSINIDLLTLS